MQMPLMQMPRLAPAAMTRATGRPAQTARRPADLHGIDKRVEALFKQLIDSSDNIAKL